MSSLQYSTSLRNTTRVNLSSVGCSAVAYRGSNARFLNLARYSTRKPWGEVREAWA